MKTLKTIILKTKYLTLALFIAFSFSCSTEDGEDGIQGEPGIAGTNGTNGNANVQTLTLDTSTLTGTSFSLAVTEITQDVLDNDAILVYLQRSSQYYPTPGVSFSDLIEVELAPADVDIYFYNRTDGASKTIPAGRYTLAKFVIIESTTGKTSAKQQVRSELAEAGININDYYAVCNFYGITH